MPHFCQDELFALMMALPWIGFVFRWARARIAGWKR